MSEYIERGAVCNDCDNQRICEDKSRCPVGRASAADVIERDVFVRMRERFMIKPKQPKDDVAEVKHGRWEARGRKNGVGKICSACVTAFNFAPTPYCPNCGAIMDGEA